MVDPSVSRSIVIGNVGYPVLISILSRLFMYMSTKTIQSKSNLLYVLLLGQSSMVIAFTSIVLSHLSKINVIVLTLGRLIQRQVTIIY